MPNKLLTVQTAAKVLKISEKTLRRWEQKGYISPIRTSGKHRRYSLDQLRSAKKNVARLKKASYETSVIRQALAITPPEVEVEVTSTKLPQPPASYVKYIKRIFTAYLIFILVTTSGYATLKVKSDIDSKKLDREASVEISGITTTAPQVLAATSFQNAQLGINVPAVFSKSITVGGDTISDFTGEGLVVVGEVLTSTLGTNITTDELVDNTISEADLLSSNTPINAQLLTYNSTTGGFTWATQPTDQVGTNFFTDSGDITYLTSTSDDFALGGTNSSSPFFFDTETGTIDLTKSAAGQWINFTDGTDEWGLYNRAGTPETFITANTGTLAMDTLNGTLYVKTDDGDATDWVNLATGASSPWSETAGLITLTTTTSNINVGGSTNLGKLAVDGDSDEVQLLIQGNGTQTSNLVVFENSSGSDLLTFSNSGQMILADGAFLDLSAILHDDTAVQGIRLPQNTALTNPSSGEGFLAWDSDDNLIKVYDGSAWSNISGASTTLQQAYSNDANGSDVLIALDATDGSLVINPIAGTSFQVAQVTSAPTTDMVSITNAGLGTTTNGVDGLAINFVTGDGTDPTNSGINLSLTSGGTGSGDILRGLLIDLASVASASSTNKAIEIENTAAWDIDIELQNDETDGVIALSGDLAINGGNITTAVTFDADVTLSQTTPSIFIVDSTAASDDYSINVDGSAFSIVNDTDVRTDISISGAGIITLTGNTDATGGLDVTGANLTVGTTQFSVDVSNGNVTSAGDLAVNGGDITSSGDLTLTLTGGDLFFTNTNTFNVGGNATDVAYSVIGDTTTGASANVDGDDDLYIEGNLEVDGSIYGGGVDITSFVCPDCVDFDDIEDTMDLDAALIVNQGTNTWTQNFTGLTTTGLTYNANSLTTGSALNITTSSNPGAAGPVSPISFNLTSTNSGTATTFNGVDIGFTSNAGIAANTEYVLQIQNEATSNTTDNATTALIRLDNADNSTAGSTVVTNGLLITNSGDIAGGIVNAINIDDSDVTTDIVLQNDETIDNDTDGTITLTAPTTSLSGDLAINGGNITTALTADSTLTVTGVFAANSGVSFTPTGTNDITFNVDTDSLLTLDSSVANGDNLVISPNNTGTGSTFTATLSTANLTADRAINIPDAAGDVCLSSGNCAGGAGGSKWTDSGSTIYLTDTGDELVLGGSSPLSSSKFSIDGDADQIQLTLQGSATQTAGLFVVENSSGTDFFVIEDLGGVAISPSSTDDVTITTDADSTIILTGLASGSGTALCLDGSNNLVTCSAGSSSATLQSAYDADTNGSDALITLSTNDDSLIFRNPASSGTDSAFNLQIDN